MCITILVTFSDVLSLQLFELDITSEREELRKRAVRVRNHTWKKERRKDHCSFISLAEEQTLTYQNLVS